MNETRTDDLPEPDPWRATSIPGVRLALAAVTAVALFVGWRTFLFLTDDAYIEFRYASNALLGRGLVWNPAPFRAVEGYTSFLWVEVLRWVWQLTGVEPPAAANPLSLLFGAGTLLLVDRLVARMKLPAAHAPFRLALLVLVLLGTLLNRTFLTSLSSGLETALFNLLFTAWIYVAATPPRARPSQWALRLTALASLATLARPDGLIAFAASLLLLVAAAADGTLPRHRMWQLLPLGLVAVHLLWRHATYGAWLPNTYYAKNVRPWPESGIRYAASFALEYGIGVWLALVTAWVPVAVYRALRSGPHAVLRNAFPTIVVIAVLAAHWGYYTLIIGGDHFEYRVYSHLIPLLFVSAAAMAVGLSARAGVAAALLTTFVAASLPIPWVHWSLTHERNTRAETHLMVVPVAGEFPPALRPVVARWDALQDWLIHHHVCMRQQEHKVFHATTVASLPPRDVGARVSWAQRPTLPAYTVGVIGWVLPNVAVIDLFGLNDRVIARGPPRSRGSDDRLMAHDRIAPPGYEACYRGNVAVDGRDATTQRRDPPLSDADIRACETRRWY